MSESFEDFIKNIPDEFAKPLERAEPRGLNIGSADVLAARLSEKLAGGERLSTEDKIELGEIIKTLRKHHTYISTDSPASLELSGKIALLNRILSEETIH